jgi:hypothetical protein
MRHAGLVPTIGDIQPTPDVEHYRTRGVEPQIVLHPMGVEIVANQDEGRLVIDRT